LRGFQRGIGGFELILDLLPGERSLGEDGGGQECGDEDPAWQNLNLARPALRGE